MATAESIAARLRELESLPGEIWRPVPEFEDRYHVSNMGRVKVLAATLNTWFGGRQARERIIKLGTHPKTGYVSIALNKARAIKHTLVHLLVLRAFVGEAPAGCETRHINGIRTDNRLENLMWGTRLENMQDQYRHGTRIRGATNAASKLTPTMVDLILTSGLTGVELSKRLGIGTSTVSRVRRGKAFATLLGDQPSA